MADKTKPVEVAEPEVAEVTDVTDGTGVVVGGVAEPLDRGLIEVASVQETKSDWVDPATVVDTVKLGYVEAAEGLLVAE